MKYRSYITSRNDLKSFRRRIVRLLDAGIPAIEVFTIPLIDAVDKRRIDKSGIDERVINGVDSPFDRYKESKGEAMTLIAKARAEKGIEEARSLKAMFRNELRPLFWKAWHYAKKNGLEYPKQLRGDS